MIAHHTIAEEARALIGTRFRHQGRDPEVGLDCVGLVLAAHAAAGIEIEAPADYPRHPDARELSGLLNQEFERLLPGMPWGPGDVLQLREDGNRYGRHVAICAHDGAMIVADARTGVRTRAIRSGAVEAAFRHREVD